MKKPIESQSFAQIIDGKRVRRDALLQAISAASPDELEAASERLKKAMRDSKGEHRRQRIDPPVLDTK